MIYYMPSMTSLDHSKKTITGAKRWIYVWAVLLRLDAWLVILGQASHGPATYTQVYILPTVACVVL